MAIKVLKKKTVIKATSAVETKPEIKKKTAVKKTTTKKKTTIKAVVAPKKEKTATKPNKNEDYNYPNAYLIIDHPLEMEIICGNHYAIRIGASPDGYVEISFNNGEWQPCRYDAGYWWFDWTYFAQGANKIAVRLTDTNGNVIVETVPRKCKIC